MTHRPVEGAPERSGWGGARQQSKSNTTPLLVGAREAAEMLGISARTLSAMTAGGELPSLLVRRRRLYPVAELERWISDRLAEGGGA